MYPFMDHFADALKGKRDTQKFATYSEWFSDEREVGGWGGGGGRARGT